MTIAIICIISLAIGFMIGRYIVKKNPQQSKLEQELQQTQAQHHAYQQQVGNYLVTTADLVNGLSDQCQHIQQHMQTGAQSLELEPEKQTVLQPNSHYIKYNAAKKSELEKPPAKPHHDRLKDYAEPQQV